ncbi:MAG TPA: ATP-binding protein [Vicinamibacterales bacterium]|jgi:signal transduction histidine kinase|nr:ATP-binding protein [Vicinamibacterales bacterium]
MHLTPPAYAFLGLTALVACLVAVLAFALLRFSAAAAETRRAPRGGGDTALLSAALQEAVTRLKAQERATAARADASERLSGEIISSLTAGLLVVGLQGEVRILNPAGKRVLGRPESQDTDGVERSAREQPLADVIDECLRDRSSIVRREVVLPTAGQGVTHLGVSVSPLFDPQGEPQGAICLFTDLTAVKDLEERLRLKESLATVGELTAGIAHEFRNGLATIQGYSKLVDLNALPASYRPYVEGIRAETESLSQVVTNFLNFARPAQLTLTEVDLGAICERAAEEIRTDARAAGGDVEVSGAFGIVEGDDVLLRQALSNLMRNAIEACSAMQRAPRITIQSEIDLAAKVSRIEIADNGLGVPPELRDRVFQPFFTTKRNGTGLGLALVQKIIVFHNGRIAVGPAAAGGASFQITLPLAG